MGAITRLIADLLVNTTGWESGLNKADATLQRKKLKFQRDLVTIGKGFENVGGQIVGLNGALTGLVGGTGLIFLSRNALIAAESIKKLSETTGLSTTSFQKYEYGAKTAGVETEQFVSALVYLNNQLAEGKLPYKTTSEALLAISERTKNASDGIERAGIAAEGFGKKAGAKMIPFLMQGSDEIQRLGREAQALGIVMDNDLIQKADAMKDQFEILGMVISRNFNAGLLSGFVGESQHIRDIYSDPEFIKGVQELGKNLGEILRFMVQHASTILQVSAAIAGVSAGAKIGGIAGPTGRLVGGFVGGAAGLALTTPSGGVSASRQAADLQAEIDRVSSQNTTKFGASFGDNTESRERYLKPLRAQLEAVKAVAGETAEALDEVTAPATSGNGMFGTMQDRASDLARINEQLTKESVIVGTQATLYGEKESVIQSAVRAKEIEFELASKNIVLTQQERDMLQEKLSMLQENKTRLEELTEATKKQKEETEAAKDTARELGMTFTSAFEDAVIEGKKFQDVLKAIADDIFRLFLRKQVTEPASNALSSIFGGGGGIGSMFGSLLGGSQGSMARLFATGSSSFIGPLPAFDTGTARVPHDMVAQIHKNEAVLTPDEADEWRNGGSRGDTYNDFRGVGPAEVARLQGLIISLAGPGRVEERVNDAMRRGRI